MAEEPSVYRAGPFHYKIKITPPTWKDRLWFAWDHLRCCRITSVLAILRGRATGVHHFDASGARLGTLFLNYGYRINRRRWPPVYVPPPKEE